VPTVYIPPLLRPMTEGQSTVQVDGFTVREVIERLDARYPGLADRLCDGADLRAGIAVAVGTQLSSAGLRHQLSPDSEVHFLPAIAGG